MIAPGDLRPQVLDPLAAPPAPVSVPDGPRRGETRKARNHRLLLAALRAGLHVDPLGGCLFLVESGEKNGSWYRASAHNLSADPLFARFYCSCPWGHHLEYGWAACDGREGPGPCKHMLLLYWLTLSPATAAAVLAQDADLAAALAVWEHITGPHAQSFTV